MVCRILIIFYFCTGTLKQWGICNQDLLYIFIRRVHQPVASIIPTAPPIVPLQPEPTDVGMYATQNHTDTLELLWYHDV